MLLDVELCVHALKENMYIVFISQTCLWLKRLSDFSFPVNLKTRLLEAAKSNINRLKEKNQETENERENEEERFFEFSFSPHDPTKPEFLVPGDVDMSLVEESWICSCDELRKKELTEKMKEYENDFMGIKLYRYMTNDMTEDLSNPLYEVGFQAMVNTVSWNFSYSFCCNLSPATYPLMIIPLRDQAITVHVSYVHKVRYENLAPPLVWRKLLKILCGL